MLSVKIHCVRFPQISRMIPWRRCSSFCHTYTKCPNLVVRWSMLNASKLSHNDHSLYRMLTSVHFADYKALLFCCIFRLGVVIWRPSPWYSFHKTKSISVNLFRWQIIILFLFKSKNYIHDEVKSGLNSVNAYYRSVEILSYLRVISKNVNI
jgi:hypothetical protein